MNICSLSLRIERKAQYGHESCIRRVDASRVDGTMAQKWCICGHLPLPLLLCIPLKVIHSVLYSSERNIFGQHDYNLMGGNRTQWEIRDTNDPLQYIVITGNIFLLLYLCRSVYVYMPQTSLGICQYHHYGYMPVSSLWAHGNTVIDDMGS